jgi:(p)ppGpp synthase/HD superfamily hydrolase
MLEIAIALAAQAHAGQKDKVGRPYVLHPLRCMLRQTEPMAMIAAVLHDVVEDTGWTLEALREAGFPAPALEAVDRVTRRAEETYEAFIERVAEDPRAVAVKLADLEDNMNLLRLTEVGERELARLARYHRAWLRLKGVEAGAGFFDASPQGSSRL